MSISSDKSNELDYMLFKNLKILKEIVLLKQIKIIKSDPGRIRTQPSEPKSDILSS